MQFSVMSSLSRCRILTIGMRPWALLGAEIGAVTGTGTSTNGFRALVADDRPAAPILAPASAEGQARIKQFKLPPGLQVDLWASEPMLANSVAFSVDELGRVWTSETYRYRTSVLDIRHYMFMLEDDLASRTIEDRLANIRKWFGPDGEKELGRETEVVRLLEDTRATGHADKSTVVVDGLRSPLDGIASGILARHGELWFTDIPSLWKFTPKTSAEQDRVGLKLPSTEGSTASLASTPQVHTNFTAEALLTGFGVRFSFTGHDLHGLKLGPDGRLYFSCGDRGTHVTTREGTVVDLPDEGAVFRCEPDGSHLEVFARGLRNPQELAFDDDGNLFTGDNDSDQGDRERWEYVVEGGDYGWRVGYQHAPLGNAGPWNMERLWVPAFPGQAAYFIPPIANIGDGPSGLVYDYGTSLPSGLRHRFLLADFKGTSARSGIYSILNRPSGAGFEMVAHDTFVWNVLVPDVDLGPDGSIWFSDWHEGWPKSNKGRLYRAYFPEVVGDPAVKETARLLAAGMKARPEAELVGLLAHRDLRVRQEAQFELAARGISSFPALRQVALESREHAARVHALWAIGQIVRPLPVSQFANELLSLSPLLGDPDPEVAAQAIRLAGDAQMGDLVPSLVVALRSPHPRQRFFAALAIARLWKTRVANGADGWRWDLGIVKPVNPPWDPLLNMAGGNVARDPILRHAAVSALAALLAETPNFLPTPQPVNEAMVEGRMCLLLALRRQTNHAVELVLTQPPSKPLLLLEAARAINDVPIVSALPTLAALGDPQRLDPLLVSFKTASAALAEWPLPNPAGVIRDVRADQPLPWGTNQLDLVTPMLVRVVNANYRLGTDLAARRLAALALRSDLPDLVRSEALRDLGTWAQPFPRDRVVGIFRPLPARDPQPAREALESIFPALISSHGPESVLAAGAEAAVSLDLTSAVPSLRGVVVDPQSPADTRASALRALVALKAPDMDGTLRLAAADPVEGLRLEASRLNAILHPEDAAGQLAAQLQSGSVAEQQGAFAALGRLKSDAADAILVDWLDRLMKREVANEVMLDLVEAASMRTATPVKSRLEAYAQWKLPQDHLTPYREALFGGSAARGRKIFYENAAVGCTRCHHIGSDGGGNAGPILDGIATRQPREHLLESIVFPNRQIAAGFETVTLTMKNGAPYAGLVKGETISELVLQTPEEGEVRLTKADIQERAKGLSGMPEGLGQLLSRQELRDVVEFLGTLK